MNALAIISLPTRDAYDWLVLGCSLVLAIVAIPGVIVAVSTLRKIERQTKATEGAAAAALMQANHVITSERAWIAIKSTMDGYVPNTADSSEYKWVIRNAGNTPARIMETQCVYELVRANALTSLPPEPQYPAPIILNGFLLPPGDSADYLTYLVSANTSEVVTRLEEGDLNTIRSGLYNLRVFGYVKYLDAFENERESRFCEHYVWPSDKRGSIGFRPLLDIPADYTKHT